MGILAKSAKNFDCETYTSTFFDHFGIFKLLRENGGKKARGIKVREIFSFIFSAIFTGKSIFRLLQEAREEERSDTPCKDAIYRFMSMERMDWNALVTRIAGEMQKEFSVPDSSNKWAFVMDDSSYWRNKSKKVELSTWCFDHANGRHYNGYRMLTLGMSDGRSFIPLAQYCMSTCNPEKERQGEIKQVAEDTPGAKARRMATTKTTETMICMIEDALSLGIESRYFIADSWFANPKQMFDVKELGLDTIGALKKGKTKYLHEGKMKNLKEIFNSSKKRRGKSRYLLSTEAKMFSPDGSSMDVRLVFVRNRNRRNDCIVFVSTDMALSEEEIITMYSWRWSIECFFKVFKQTLNAVSRCRALDYDQIHCNNSIALMQYQMLSYLQRINNDERTIGELFWYIYEDDKSAEFQEALNIVLALFADRMAERFCLPQKMVASMLEEFITSLPCTMSGCLKLTA